jgi:ribosome biogenesis protein ERB1
MAATAANGSKKRKHAEDELKGASRPDIPDAIGLDLHSDEEEEGGEDSDGDVDEFPELDTRSDSNDGEDSSDEEEASVDEDENEEDESEDGSETGTDDELSVFPKAKVVTSEITGQPKKVYPEIEPDYDSDSSTEDVSILHSRSCS